MRLLLLCLPALLLTLSTEAGAENKSPPRPASDGGSEIHYFTSIDGLMGGAADVILKETRQGPTVTAAVLDVCYPMNRDSDRKDRFIANLSVQGQTLSGTTQSLGAKAPVSIQLTRKPTGETFEFRGQMTIGSEVTEVASSDNADISEKEFLNNEITGDGIVAAPTDFTEVSPEAIAVRIKLEAVNEFLNSLRGQDIEIALASLPVSCAALRAGEQTITMSVDPERAGALVEKFRTMPGVSSAGWTPGLFDVLRTVRINAADWRNGQSINRDKLAAQVAQIAAKTLSAKAVSSTFDPASGRLKLVYKRPNQDFPSLNLTDTIELTAMIAPEKPGTFDHLLVWINSPSITTADENSGARLNLSDLADDDSDQSDDPELVDALARDLKGERWDSDKSTWLH
ncbi:MAG: hypothetical protein FWD68_04995 [Alphaproteobacteria bacterium]|nr:hypothetical protein [Alphaproteobacteria bacterium]